MINKLLIILIFCIFSYGSEEINSNNFEETLKKENIVIIDFYADWCGWCTKLQTFVDKNKYKTYKINVDSNLELAKQFKIKSYPTIIIFKDGYEIKKVSGFDETKQLIKKYNIKEDNL